MITYDIPYNDWYFYLSVSFALSFLAAVIYIWAKSREEKEQ